MRSNSAMRCLLAVLCVSGAFACGGDEGNPPLPPRTNGRKDAGPNDTDGAVPDAGRGVNPNAPVVELVSPDPAADPNDDTVITTEMLSARCRVAKAKTVAARDVNLTSVRIMLINPEDELHPIAGVVAAQSDSEFEAEFKLTDLVNGRWKLRCEADDMNKPALTGRATVDTFIDLGPTVELIDPVDGSAHRLLGNVAIKFRVREAPLSASDTESTPTAIALQVSGVDYEFTESQDEPGLYIGAVNFDDRKMFPMPPTTASIVVTAQSSRTPEAPTRRAKADITIDSAGPVITVKSPGYTQIVRSEVDLVIQVSDESGIDVDTLVGTISLPDKDYILSDWKAVGATFVETFDTRSFDPTLTQLTINIVAEDRVGNLSEPATHVLRIDNVAPLVSLDPPWVREYKISDGLKICSAAFDPVGEDAVSDLGTATVQAKFRTAVEERTNYAPGADLYYIAGVNKATMRIYAQPDPSIPLLIDSDGDDGHVCDEINFDALPVPQRPVALDLKEVADKGSAYYAADPAFLADDSKNVPASDCSPGTAAEPPKPLCSTTPMFRVMTQNIVVANPPTAIYGWNPTNSPTNGECNGSNWELLPIVDEGWACLAARVEDAIGNVGISTPIRVCFDDNVGTPQCNPLTDTPPECTDGCVWPEGFAPNRTLLAR
jgi:hypothetical protein